MMFPRIMHHVWHQVADETDKTTPINRWHLVVWNASGWDAVDAEAEVRLRDGRIFSGKRRRLRPASTGSTAPTPEDDRLVVEMLDMPSDTQAGYGLVVATVVRWSDAQHIATWEAQRDWTNGYATPFQDSIRQIGGPSLTTN